MEGREGRTVLVSAGGTQEKLAVNGIFVARSVSTIKKGKTPIKLVNTRADPFTIYGGTRVAQVEFNVENKEEAFSIIYPPTSDLEKQKDPLDTVSFENSDMTAEQKEQLMARLRKYPSVISHGQNDLGSTDLMTHRIPTGDHQPIVQRAHRLAPPMRPVVTKLLDDMVKSGAVEPSTSPWASPIVLVKKKSGISGFVLIFEN